MNDYSINLIKMNTACVLLEPANTDLMSIIITPLGENIINSLYNVFNINNYMPDIRLFTFSNIQYPQQLVYDLLANRGLAHPTFIQFNTQINLGYLPSFPRPHTCQLHFIHDTLIWLHNLLQGHIHLFIAPSLFFINLCIRHPITISIIYIFSSFNPVNASSGIPYNILQRNNLISFIIGWLAYVFSFGTYDYFFKRVYNSFIPIFINNSLRINPEYIRTWFILRLAYIPIINLGVYFSSSFFYYLNNLNMNNRALYTLVPISYIISYFASTRWFTLAARDRILSTRQQLRFSFERCLAESFAFNFLSLANFIIWDLFSNAIHNNRNIYAIVIGLVTYFVFAPLQMYLEITGNFPYLYGFVYNFSFTGLSLSSTGLYSILIESNIQWLIRTMFITSGAGIFFVPIIVYRNTGNVTFQRITHDSLYQLFLFYCFAIFSFKLLGYFPVGTI